jgi:hypothetical protein
MNSVTGLDAFQKTTSLANIFKRQKDVHKRYTFNTRLWLGMSSTSACGLTVQAIAQGRRTKPLAR